MDCFQQVRPLFAIYASARVSRRSTRVVTMEKLASMPRAGALYSNHLHSLSQGCDQLGRHDSITSMITFGKKLVCVALILSLSRPPSRPIGTSSQCPLTPVCQISADFCRNEEYQRWPAQKLGPLSRIELLFSGSSCSHHISRRNQPITAIYKAAQGD
jgi:hypothetical protein